MDIHFVNHAAVIIETGDVRLISDPWLQGRAFDDGWALLSESVMTYEDFASITHIWFSHEHPDHFSPPNLKKIPEEIRKKITVLYQETLDRKVVGFCKKLGFGDVIELPVDRWTELAPGVRVKCAPYADGWGAADSWLLLESPEARVLNINDCDVATVSDAKELAEDVGPVDLLLTQFSYASWDGNPEDRDRRRAYAKEKLEEVGRQTAALRPKYLMPFASYVWFCHEENHYLTADVNRIDRVHDYIRDQTDASPVVMYPGDHWTYGQPQDSTSAIKRYLEDYERVSADDVELVAAKNVDHDTLVEASRAYGARLLDGTTLFAVKSHLARKQAQHALRGAEASLPQRVLSVGKASLFPEVEPAHIYVEDLERAYRFDLEGGLQPIDRSRRACDVAVGSGPLHYAFKFMWGGQTLQINGRFREMRPGSKYRLFKYFRLAFARNTGFVPTVEGAVTELVDKVRNRLSPR